MSVYRAYTSNSWSKDKSWEKRKIHHRNMVKMYNSFDKFTSYRYHVLIKKAISRHKFKYKKEFLKNMWRRVFNRIKL
jgi:hypothetical protein